MSYISRLHEFMNRFMNSGDGMFTFAFFTKLIFSKGFELFLCISAVLSPEMAFLAKTNTYFKKMLL